MLIEDFRFLVEEFELVSQHVPRVLLEDISKSYDEQLTYEIEQAEEKFYRTVAMLEKEKVINCIVSFFSCLNKLRLLY